MSPCNYTQPQIYSGEGNSVYLGSSGGKVNSSISPKPVKCLLPRPEPFNQPSPTNDGFLMFKQRLHLLRSKQQNKNRFQGAFSAQNSPRLTRRQSLIKQQHPSSPISAQYRAAIQSSRPSLHNFISSPNVTSASSFYDLNSIDVTSCMNYSKDNPSIIDEDESSFKHRRKQCLSPSIKGLNCCFKDL